MMTGQAIKSLAKREEIIIATKVGLPMPDGSSPRGLSKDLIEKHVHQSLKKLDTDYIDLYQIHRWYYTTPIEETMKAGTADPVETHVFLHSGNVDKVAQELYSCQNRPVCCMLCAELH